MHLRERARERKRDIDGEERKRRYWLVVNFNSDNISRIISHQKNLISVIKVRIIKSKATCLLNFDLYVSDVLVSLNSTQNGVNICVMNACL